MAAGASAGSIVAAMAACKTEKELEQMFDPGSYRNFNMLGTLEVCNPWVDCSGLPVRDT